MAVQRGESTFVTIADTLAAEREGVQRAKMFGMPCIKIGNKAFAGYFDGHMAFKLTGEAHREALALSGARLFDPSGRNRPMKEWVQVPAAHADQWPLLAEAAIHYVSGRQDT